MKLISIIIKTTIIISLGIINSNAADGRNIFNERNYRQTKSYADEMLDAEAFYEAALKGELASTETKKAFLFSELHRIGEKPNGVTPGGIYEDFRGDIWFVKQGQNPLCEYLGSKIMDLLIGSGCPEVQIFADEPDLTAAKLLHGFLTQQTVENNPIHKDKPITGALELEIAMNVIELGDRKNENQGYIDHGNRLQAARVDFDSSFISSSLPLLPLLTIADLNAIKIASAHIASIPDEQILYVLGDAYNKLWETGNVLNYQDLKNLGNALIKRKNQNYVFQLNEALIEAIKKGLIESVELLIQAGADPISSFALSTAAKSRHIAIIELLIEKGADPKNPDVLISAARSGSIEIIKLFIEKGANPKNLKALNLAIRWGYIEIVKFLIEKGADPTKTDSFAILEAKIEGYDEIIQLLIEYEVTIPDFDLI